LWARRRDALAPFRDTGASVAATAAALGAASDILAICVVDDAGVDDVLRGPDGALAAMADGSVVIVHSSVHPHTCLRLQDDFPDLRVLDAPVSGGGHKAAEGELFVMVGGPTEVVESCRPLLETFGDPVLHMGGLGSGQEAKILNNAVFAAQLAVAAEVFALAAARGLDRQAVAAVVSNGSARSYAAEVVAGGGFGLEALAPFAGALLAKDIGILIDLAGPDRLADSALLAAADRALELMGLPRSGRA